MDTFGSNNVSNNDIWKNLMPVNENSIIIYNPLSKDSSVEMALCSSKGIKPRTLTFIMSNINTEIFSNILA